MLLLALTLACGKSDLPPPPTADGGAATDSADTTGEDTDPGGADGGATDGGATDGGTGGTDGGTTDGGTTGRYHPDGYLDPSQHSMEAKHQVQDCTGCHGADLTGEGDAPSCDTCHTPSDPQAWRTDCTFCHGGADNSTGAPPEDIDDQLEGVSFAAHSAHVVDTELHRAFGCEQCHQVPADALSAGHFMVGDDSPGEAELDFSGGLSAAGFYEGGASCSSLYCHGNGYSELGGWSEADGAPGCGDCHAYYGASTSAWQDQSGKHDTHAGEREEGCVSCHPATAGADSASIADTSLHLNGVTDVELPVGMSYEAGSRTCDGECHGQPHNSKTWTDAP